MTDPRAFFFALSAAPRAEEVPLAWLRKRGWDIPGPEQCTEMVAPGVRMKLMGTGGIMLPDCSAPVGALVAVWGTAAGDRKEGCRHCGDVITRCPSPGHVPVCKGWVHPALEAFGPVGPHYCEGRSVNPSAEPDGEAH